MFRIILNFALLIAATSEQSDQYKLYNELFTNYNKEIRPSSGEGEAVNVTMDLVLYSIDDTDELHEAISFNVWFHVEWEEPLFAWNSTDYGGINEIEVSAGKLWMPDIYLKGVRDIKSIPEEDTSLCDVYSHGLIHCEFNRVILTHCDYKITRFPYDRQNCSFVFGSWKYGLSEMDLSTNLSGANIKFFKPNNEWRLMSFKNRKDITAGSRKHFAKITYFLEIQRKPLHYVMTLIMPSFLITILALIGLFSPFSSHGERQEKVTMGLTMLLTMSVLLLVVSDQMPKTSSGVPPFLGLYILFQFIMGAIGVILTVVIMRLQQRSLRSLAPPMWLEKLVRSEPDKTAVGTNHENDLYNQAKQAWIEKGRGSYGMNSVLSKVTSSEVEAMTDREFIGPNIMEMVKILKSCFAHLETISEYVEDQRLNQGLAERWRLICDKLDRICMIVLPAIDIFITFLLLIIYGATN